jgi:biopolymer transport protein TolR
MWSPTRKAEQRASKRRSAVLALINLWPFTAVLIVLLVIFMTHTRPLHDFRGLVDLPTSVSAVPEGNARREDAIQISVMRDGGVYFGHTEMRFQDLAPAVQNAIRDGAEKKVYISADARAKNIDVERVVDELRRVGITQVSFITH